MMYECLKCDFAFEKSDQYEAKFCPTCGDSLEKAVEENTDLICEGCESVFEKSLDTEYELSYCVKCGKSLTSFQAAMAVAPRATGDSPTKGNTDGPKEGKVGVGSGDRAAMAVAPDAEGDDPTYTAMVKKETGTTVKDQGEGANAIDGNDKEGYAVADGKDTDMREPRPAGKRLEEDVNPSDAQFRTPPPARVDVYEYKGTANPVRKSQEPQDEPKVSIEERLEQIEKSLKESTGRKTLVPAALEEKIEKSVASQEAIDRDFIKTLFGR